MRHRPPGIMSFGLEYSEGQRDYLERIGVGPLLEDFVADAVREKPNDVYEFLRQWATARCAKATAATHEKSARVIQRAFRNYRSRSTATA